MKVRGFTLVEILIVVIILGILAAIVVPQFASASEEAKRSATHATLKTIRGQIELYKIQHKGNMPNLSMNWSALTKPTNVNGGTMGSGPFPYGPYLPSEPVNPYNGKSGISNTESSDKGWLYTAASGKIQPIGIDGQAMTLFD